MLNRDKMAYEILLKILDSTDYVDTLAVSHAFELADEYLERTKKNTERPAVIGDGWISVDDRLPEDEQRVLVYRPDAHLEPACDPNLKICEYSVKYRAFLGSSHDVTHWQALPNPPKGKK